MAEAISRSGMLFTDSSSSSCPRLCFYHSKVSGSLHVKVHSTREVGRSRRPLKKQLNLSSSFLDAWYQWRLSATPDPRLKAACSRKRFRKLSVVVGELGGQYEEIFNDVKMQIRNYFTSKAVRTVLYQLHEMNPPQYTWFYNFVRSHEPEDGRLFLQALAKEKQELAERVMITRLHLYSKWIKVRSLPSY
ncbi:hypothetical protein RJ639_014838 [Escallonia herrerae]|uniref:Uncharacterized protein n=1 Tax=Escallonia herrerae TaxID=1293975 RepID=A0AA88VGG7_9ASTE|nr:hypothetical protein RJ639_014838 [Escallonia herrerae]